MVPEAIRIRFTKTGRLRYISHLDLCRTMCPAMIRSKIPLWYTEGFNPHPKMVFAQPLPLFVESRCELLDIKITEEMSHEELTKRLREAFTAELYVEEVYTPTEKFSEIAFAEYEIKGLGISSQNVETLLSGELKIVKNTKSGQKLIDIRPQVKSVDVLDDGAFKCVLSASAESYLNPDIFCKAVSAKLGRSEPDVDITRVAWYRSDMTLFR